MKRSSLKLWQRVLIVAATSSLPLLVFASYLINISVSREIRFTLQEMRGTALQRPLVQLLDLLPQYQAVARRVLAGETSAAEAQLAIRSRIDSALDQLVGHKGEVAGWESGPTDLERLMAGWHALRPNFSSTPAAEQGLAELGPIVRRLIEASGNASNLILDTDLDSFYLVDLTLNTLPQTEQRLGEIILQVGDWGRRDEVPAHQNQIATMAAMLRRDDEERILKDVRTSLRHNARDHGAGTALQAHLPAALEQYLAANRKFLGMLDRLIAGEAIPGSDFETAGWESRSASFNLGAVAVLELDSLLAARVAGYRRTEFRDFAGIAATLGLTALAVWLVSVEVDITDRKETDAKLRRLKNHLANMIDSMPAALVGLDRAGCVTQWNRQAEVLTGVGARSAIGRMVYELLPEFAAWILTLVEETDASGPVSLESVVVEKAGENHFFNLMLYPLVANGTEGAVLRIEDVTERHRVAALMVQNEKMISLGGLAAGMAHELNNPLGIISQAAQNIERWVSPDLPANQKVAAELGLPLDLLQTYFQRRAIPAFLQDIREAANRAAKIISNMLQFSRKSGKERKAVALAEVMNRTLDLAANDYDLRKQFDFRNIEIIREFQSDLPDLPVVEVEIQQVILNLLKNATQAMLMHPTGRPPVITLRLRREDRYVVMEVLDNGPGMPEKVARRVFEPFFTTKSPGIGTGLGLSVSYMIITQNHQGLISVETTPGSGARFIIKLPLPQKTSA